MMSSESSSVRDISDVGSSEASWVLAHQGSCE